MTAMADDSDKRVVRAFLAAPIVSVATLVVALVIYLAALSAQSLDTYTVFAAALLMTFYAFMIGIPVAYALTFLVCMPVYWVLRRNGTLSRGTVILCAVMISIAATIIGLGMILREPASAVVLSSALMAVSGMVGALTFWRVAFGSPGF